MKLKPEQEAATLAMLKGLDLFTGCSEIQLKSLIEKLDLQSFGKNKVVLMEQEISRTLFILTEGSVGIWRRQSGEKRLVASLKAPDFFGETSMFLESPANALVKAEEPCQLLTLSREAFNDLTSRDATFGLLIERNMGVVEEKRPSLAKKTTSEESN